MACSSLLEIEPTSLQSENQFIPAATKPQKSVTLIQPTQTRKEVDSPTGRMEARDRAYIPSPVGEGSRECVYSDDGVDRNLGCFGVVLVNDSMWGSFAPTEFSGLQQTLYAGTKSSSLNPRTHRTFCPGAVVDKLPWGAMAEADYVLPMENI